jgi:hypothetical protein
MIISVIKAEYQEDYKINLHFDNGDNGIVDLKETILNDHRAIFMPLRDLNFFKTISLNSWTLEWPNEADFSPEFLYELAMSSKVVLSKKEL